MDLVVRLSVNYIVMMISETRDTEVCVGILLCNLVLWFHIDFCHC